MSAVPLHSCDAENGVLGALLRLANHSGEEIARDAALSLRERLPGAAFFHSGQRTVYEAIQSLADARRPFDLITLTQTLRDAGMDDIKGEVRGVWSPSAGHFLAELSDFTPTAGELRSHAEIIHRKHLRRQIALVCRETMQAAEHEQDGDERQLLDHAQARMLAISERSSIEETFRLPQAGVMAAISKLEAAYENRGGISGLPSGLIDIDRSTTGWKPGQMIVVAGSTGMGKTSLMLQWAAHLVFRCNLPVAFFSLEMSYEELIERLVYAEARVSLQRARDGHLSNDNLDRFNKAAQLVARSLLYVDDFPGLNIFEFRARARRAVKKFGARAIFGDYLQLFDDSGEGGDDNRVQELQRISRGIKLVAKELAIPVFIGAQLNAKPDERKSSIVVNPFDKDEETQRPKRVPRYGVPQLSDLRECKAIGMDADMVIFPFRPWYFSKLDEDRKAQHIEWAQIIIGKQRNGPVGTHHVYFIDDETRFESLPDENGLPRENLYSTAAEQQQPGYAKGDA